jgi:hypothetical protein
MGINARSSLDPRWTKHNRKIVASFMLSSITIRRKDNSVTAAYDQATGVWTAGFTTIFTGEARIQPIRLVRDKLSGQDETSRQNIQVQIDSIATGISVDDILEVTASASFPELTEYTFDVRSALGNSTSWNTILICEVNLKKRN